MRNLKACWMLVFLAAVGWCMTVSADDAPENLAPLAKVSASSVFSDAYRPEMAVSGVVPSVFTQDSDWCVKATQTGSFTLQWEKPVDATQIIYYARVTSPLVECFKDYRVLLDDAGVVVVGHKADLLALGLGGRGQAGPGRELPHLRLGELAQGEQGLPQLLGRQAARRKVGQQFVIRIDAIHRLSVRVVAAAVVGIRQHDQTV